MNPANVDELQASAVAARIELDLRIGAAFTRFQTLSLQNIPGLEKKVLSYGSCQFPTLGFVVDRYWRVVKFVPEKFWSLEVILEKNGKGVGFKWGRGRLFDKGVVTILYERCLLGARRVRVEAANKKPTRKWYVHTTITLNYHMADSHQEAPPPNHRRAPKTRLLLPRPLITSSHDRCRETIYIRVHLIPSHRN